MGFMKSIQDEILENYNTSITENGAVGYKTTGKALLDLNFAVSSLRNKEELDIANRFAKAFFEDKLLAMKWLFFARDVRGGLGERRLFRVALKWLAVNDSEYVKKVIPLIAEYGRWDDMWCLLDVPELKDTVLYTIKKQYEADIEAYHNNKPISLLAKWLPSTNASSKTTKRFAKIIRQSLGLTEREYRKDLSAFRKYLKVVEVDMSAKQWDNIDYQAVPSKANILYNSAFLRNDEVRRREFLASLEKGEVKINASTLFPHDVVHQYFDGDGYWSIKLKHYDSALEGLWKSLPDTVKGCGNTIVVADGSGSMTVSVGNTKTRAIEVANALAIYFAEHSSGEFKDKYITFSMRPKFVDFSNANSLRDKLYIAIQNNEVANTNVEAVFDLILNTAIRNQMGQDDIPANILIISDMEFDRCACRGKGHYGEPLNANLFKEIEKRYKVAGYKLPRLVFWNVSSRTNTIPIRENELGVALVSGFSPNVCKMVMSSELDPFKCLLETLNSERYAAISKVFEE